MSAKVNIDWKTLDALLQFKVTLKFCAEYLGVSIDSIQRRCKEEKLMTFEEYHQSKLARTATKLQQKAIEMALGGDRTMLIFCLKNLAGWADKVESINANSEITYEQFLKNIGVKNGKED